MATQPEKLGDKPKGSLSTARELKELKEASQTPEQFAELAVSKVRDGLVDDDKVIPFLRAVADQMRQKTDGLKGTEREASARAEINVLDALTAAEERKTGRKKVLASTRESLEGVKMAT